MNKPNKKYDDLKNKLENNKEFIEWNKKFTKKMNIAILVALGVSGLMVVPILMYATNIISTLSGMAFFYKVGIYGLICGAGVVTTAVLLNTALIINKLYLKKVRNNLTKKMNNIVKLSENNNKSPKKQKTITKSEEKQKTNNNENVKKNSQSYKYIYDPNKQSDYKTSLISSTNSKQKKAKKKKKIIK